ncbi:DUF6544 family protein [Marinobacterium sediminicola]|uniref:DUF4166 domain-containing protein n=1 Tax=Marinobacterium sediminicola TaxID=518898 RepID=A0ABY1S1G9_9GAMM|nr:DUF6544 family protein [Marinobacterium sediminicola]ULG69821.1 hypothetical protein LN244_03155 [Marinobacterium sediminicola]SMR75365.1 hypothetical protein SAMN04487964_10927 [Marinobacterium sediminicola]
MNEPAAVQPQQSLPAPVAAWLAKVLPEWSKVSSELEILQSGRLRTDMDQSRWLTFSARQRVWPLQHAFIWQAKVGIFPGAWVSVRDGFHQGQGRGEVRLFSLIPLARERGGSELNSAALMRFLAESVWYPAMLISDPCIRWQSLSARSAQVEIHCEGVSATLIFYFNEQDEVCRVYSPGRYCREGHKYRLRPWEARLEQYQRFEGALLPTRAEVGWYRLGVFQPVWQGRVESVRFRSDAGKTQVEWG